MAAVTFDTHRFVRKLKEAGFDDRQAEALTDAVQESHQSLDVATKQDIDDLRKDMDAKFAAIDAKLEKLFLRLIIWLGSIIFVIVNAGPILPKIVRLLG